MTKLRITERGAVPYIECDVCGQPIDDIRLGAASFVNDGDIGLKVDAKLTHKGKCHNEAERSLGGLDKTGWFELSDFLGQLLSDEHSRDR